MRRELSFGAMNCMDRFDGSREEVLLLLIFSIKYARLQLIPANKLKKQTIKVHAPHIDFEPKFVFFFAFSKNRIVIVIRKIELHILLAAGVIIYYETMIE